MNESDYKRRLVKAVNALPGGWARRVEDRYAVNVLDMIIKLPGHMVVFAEGKIITGNVFGPSPGQFEEGRRLLSAGLLPLLIGWKAGEMYISKAWMKQADIRACWIGGEPKEWISLLNGYLHTYGDPQ